MAVAAAVDPDTEMAARVGAQAAKAARSAVAVNTQLAVRAAGAVAASAAAFCTAHEYEAHQQRPSYLL